MYNGNKVDLEVDTSLLNAMAFNCTYLSNYSNLVTPEMRSRLNSLHKELAYDKLIFSDEIYDNQGKLRCEKDNVISDDMLLEDINWLVRGVE